MAKTLNAPHAPWSHLLKNGAKAGDPTKAPRCGAKTRLKLPCRSPAMKNGRCRMHGGTNSGPVTPEGLARSLEALRRVNEERRKLRESRLSDATRTETVVSPQGLTN